MDPLTLLVGALAGVVVGVTATALALRARLAARGRRAVAAERRAQQSERLAELGSMTSGLAHEIKNPLSTVVLNAQLVAEEIAESELPEESRGRLQRRVDALGREATRLRDILADFLRFAGRIRLDATPRDLRTIVEEVADFFLPQSERHGVVQRLELPADEVVANVDVDLLKQALLNLMLNAVQAMSGAAEDRGRTRPRELILRIERGRTDRQDTRGAKSPPSTEEPNEEARIHVIDTGPGIDASRRDAIFRPYMTDKPGGTGLGLATTRRIVEEHGGRIRLWSEPGTGSDFAICLPLVTRASPSA